MYNQPHQNVQIQEQTQSNYQKQMIPYPVPPSVETVDSSLSSLEHAISSLQESIIQLATSLRPIMLDVDEGVGQQTCPPSQGVDMIDRIQTQLIRILASTRHVEDLRARNRV